MCRVICLSEKLNEINVVKKKKSMVTKKKRKGKINDWTD